MNTVRKTFCLFIISAIFLTFATEKLNAATSSDREIEFRNVSKRGYYLRGIIPGWGQYYAGYHTKGLVFLGSFGLSGGVFTWSLFNMMNKKQSYDELGYNSAQSLFDRRWKDYKNASILALSLGLVMGAVYTASWVDLIVFSHYTGKKKNNSLLTEKKYILKHTSMFLRSHILIVYTV